VHKTHIMPEPRYGVLNLIEIGLACDGVVSGDYHMRETVFNCCFQAPQHVCCA
jgi:hypothetical protein